jgi:hypothetical protein
MPMIHELCRSVSVPVNIQIADRIIDSLNALSTAKHKRLTLEQERLPGMLWIVQYILSTIMFTGVLLIFSGSMELNIFFCFSTSILIGINSLLIADMDMPFIGYMCINKQPLTDLIQDMKDSARPSHGATKESYTEMGADRTTNSLENLAKCVIATRQKMLTTQKSLSDTFTSGKGSLWSKSTVRQAMRPTMKPAKSAQIFNEVKNNDDDMVVTNV